MSRSYYHHCTLTGTVIAVNNIDGANFLLRTRAKDDFYVYITGETYFKSLKNLDERPENSRDRYAPFVGDWGKLTLEQKVAHYVALGALVTVEGILAINELKRRVDARTVHLLYQQDNVPISEKKGSFAFEGGHWWLSQIGAMADGWLHSLWPNESDNFDFDSYLTNLDMTFRPTGDKSQESATLSRLIYGLSSAFLLTGVERYYASAKAGVEFLRKNFRTTTNEGDHVLWFTKRVNGVSMMEPTSGEDQGSIPLYEQIYCLAGLTQYYRITQDWGVLDDIVKTVTAFQRFWYDTSQYGGWFSHLDYATLSPKSDYLRANNATKNWNSIGDHIPAYLLNLLLALDPLPEKIDNTYMQNFVQVLRKILRESTMLIVEKFPEEGVDYVQERFFQDWTRDKTHTWQQNRAIVGHNLKIAWNLTRVANYYDRNPDDGVNLEKIMAVAEKLALTMVKIGAVDLHRGGCYDAVERIPKNNQSLDFAWMNTKDFWQQEQGILAYYILYGRTHKNEYLDYARDMTSFWNVFFLDQDNKAAYFRTTDDGLPFIKDGYGAKAGHSIAGYHSFELNFLVHIYIMTYVRNKQFCLYFRPSFKSINVAPDGFPGSMNLKITKCLWNGIELGNSAHNFTVKIPDGDFFGGGHERTLSVQFTPVVAHKPSRSLISEGISFTNLSLKPVTKGKIGVIVESHFDETEVRRFEEVFPEQGYEVEYISYLWNQKFLFFTGNDHNDPLYVSKDITTVNPDEYLGFVFIGGYAMDRLRYEADPIKGKPNHSPTVEFLRKVVNIPRLKIGAICHSLWVFCAAKETLAQRQVTCANNILYDVLNAGGVPIYNPNGVGMVPTFVDKKEGSAVLITGQHPGVVEEFVKVYLAELAK